MPSLWLNSSVLLLLILLLLSYTTTVVNATITCGCPDTCNPMAMAESNGAKWSCGTRILWLMNDRGESEMEACRQASLMEGSTQRGHQPCRYDACHPEGCQQNTKKEEEVVPASSTVKTPIAMPAEQQTTTVAATAASKATTAAANNNGNNNDNNNIQLSMEEEGNRLLQFTKWVNFLATICFAYHFWKKRQRHQKDNHDVDAAARGGRGNTTTNSKKTKRTPATISATTTRVSSRGTRRR